MSERLAALDDSAVIALLDETASPTVGFGGTTSSIDVGGVPVFVKRVPLTDRERQPDNVGSTANLFGLPLFYQYGIGSAGFGAWREVAVHTMTTRWVLEQRFDGFPLLYHRRVLPQAPQPADPDERERWVAHWEGNDAVRARLEAISSASAAVVLFMEHIPQTVDAWLRAQPDGEAYEIVDRALQEGVEFMRTQGLLHFDAHFLNLLTDGRRLYFADFGLAVHTGFDLTAAESAFVRRHRDYDRGYTATHLTQWLLSNLLDIPWADSLGHIRDRGLPRSAARIVARHRPVATVIGGFYRELLTGSKRTPFPADDLDRALRVTRRV
ncbi:serine/threonine protein phosphatase [Actinoplanes sp. NPDC026619]|uniref:serine/threonine protein phosphatase n=1 Tax=Actinoplanes sp. NPDC026619 TaxID=3155798 RepID=UPI0033C25E7F